jgi:alpha-L-fucosidase
MMQPWFPDAKLGIFIHWGVYAVNGIPESWSFFNEQIAYPDYMKQLDGFTATNYDPDAWADLFARAGARYAVLTTKHHDGVALWDTALSDLSVVKKTPAGRDLIAPYCDALRAKGLKVGLYFSHLDWSHPDYSPAGPGVTKTSGENGGIWGRVWTDGAANPTWRRFLAFQRGQLRELSERFRPDLLWFDGDWTPSREWWGWAETRRLLDEWAPQAVVNSRLGDQGDYATPEQGVPIAPPAGPWEFCVTMNDSWGYQGRDTNYKSVRQIVRMLAECVGMGGNLLLDIGPMADGTIPAEQVERLEGLGAWTHKHAEAVYPTTAGLPAGHLYGASTLSKDRTTLYAFLFDRPWDEFAVKGIRNPVKRVSVVGTGEELPFRKIGGASWAGIPGVLWGTVPESALDPNATVLKIELDGPLDLYTGSGHAIEAN